MAGIEGSTKMFWLSIAVHTGRFKNLAWLKTLSYCIKLLFWTLNRINDLSKEKKANFFCAQPRQKKYECDWRDGREERGAEAVVGLGFAVTQFFDDVHLEHEIQAAYQV